MRNIFNFIDQIPNPIQFTEQEISWINLLVNSNLDHTAIWGGAVNSIGVRRKDRDIIITKIKTDLSVIQDGYCYYCGIKFDLRVGELGNQSIEREHVAPKSLYKRFTFEPSNLVLACSICNGSNYKGSSNTIDNFIQNTNYRDCSFNIIHPYLDIRTEHLCVNENDGSINVVGTSIKGRNTLRMFNLNEIFWVSTRSTDFRFRRYNVDTIEEYDAAIIEEAIQNYINTNHIANND